VSWVWVGVGVGVVRMEVMNACDIVVVESRELVVVGSVVVDRREADVVLL